MTNFSSAGSLEGKASIVVESQVLSQHKPVHGDWGGGLLVQATSGLLAQGDSQSVLWPCRHVGP
jgi:hypothetical protein